MKPKYNKKLGVVFYYAQLIGLTPSDSYWFIPGYAEQYDELTGYVA